MLALLGRIPVGFGGLQAGLQGRSSNASASLPAVCPIRLRGSSSGARGGPVVLHVINDVNRELGATVMIVTHAAATAQMAHRVIHFADGAIRET